MSFRAEISITRGRARVRTDIIARCVGAGLSDAADHDHRAVACRRPGRHPGAAFRPSRCALRSASRWWSRMSAVPRRIAVARVARAEPDGYTMILGTWTGLVGTPRSIRCRST